MAKLVQEELQKHGVGVYLQEDITEIRGENGRVTEVVTERTSFSAQAVGIIPNSEMAIAPPSIIGVRKGTTIFC